MAVEFEMTLTGDLELDKFIAGLAQSGQNRIMRPGVRAGASVISKAAKQKARRFKRTGQLAKAIGVSKVKTYPGGAVFAAVGPRTGFKMIFEGKPVNPTQYAHLVEFGTAHSEAKPFLRPAFDLEQGRAIAASQLAAVKAVDKEVDRLRKKGTR
ncbi:HK97-gp10 family putative phage morphogenesis protein [Cerasicoccus frondis]|uniref:HK97-gp10 family putative phage morphogenesis protein n=1 Tax=Cerasicoccus frondis TaxID=490090 RepID=UPI0028528455|nr:HK97-gp10 family putative phage morphogenesis protein [Cerasicoccus frondis]